MNYKFMKNDNYEDFSSGRVIYHKSGMPNFPVRLAGEIFHRCLCYLEIDKVRIYDPCCGNGYLLTVLAMMNKNKIKHIYASDIDKEALNIAKSNLSLLTLDGLEKRKVHILDMIDEFQKPSHYDALSSIERFIEFAKKDVDKIDITLFQNDVLNNLLNVNMEVDLVIVDVPYGNLVSWSNDNDAVNLMLKNLKPVLNPTSVLAVITNKSQKVRHPGYRRLEKFQVGKRVIHIIKQ